MHDFFHSFTAWHFVALVGMACLNRLGRFLGKSFGRSLIELNGNLKALRSTIVKAEIIWERTADHQMLAEYGRRMREHTV